MARERPRVGLAGGAAAAYAAKAGLGCVIAMPADTPSANIIESRAFGADVRLINGLISDCGKFIAERDILKLPDPDRCQVIEMLNELLTLELTAINQHFLHAKMLENWGWTELAEGFRKQGLQVYAPDQNAFRAHAQKVYLASDEAKEWPKGMLEKINALK